MYRNAPLPATLIRVTLSLLPVLAVWSMCGCTGGGGLTRRQLDSIELEKETFSIFVKDSGTNVREATREAILLVDSADRSTLAYQTCSAWLARKGVDTAAFKLAWAGERRRSTDSLRKEAEQRLAAGAR
ncbi:hypothetical protein [Flaviaesturariibacter amylovorans]|uniref:DUF4398 domain-containing protein n=1 Tax=Flaviaesturariibacter amylovorans TaxID=1084520 RepID=A0ABP8HTG9_9BACT